MCIRDRFVFDLFGPLKALYGEASRLTVMNAALDRIEAVLDEPELSDNGKQRIPAQAQPGQPDVYKRQNHGSPDWPNHGVLWQRLSYYGNWSCWRPVG